MANTKFKVQELEDRFPSLLSSLLAIIAGQLQHRWCGRPAATRQRRARRARPARHVRKFPGVAITHHFPLPPIRPAIDPCRVRRAQSSSILRSGPVPSLGSTRQHRHHARRHAAAAGGGGRPGRRRRAQEVAGMWPSVPSGFGAWLCVRRAGWLCVRISLSLPSLGLLSLRPFSLLSRPSSPTVLLVGWRVLSGVGGTPAARRAHCR